jgi:hypothetical protein
MQQTLVAASFDPFHHECSSMPLPESTDEAICASVLHMATSPVEAYFQSEPGLPIDDPIVGRILDRAFHSQKLSHAVYVIACREVIGLGQDWRVFLSGHVPRGYRVKHECRLRPRFRRQLCARLRYLSQCQCPTSRFAVDARACSVNRAAQSIVNDLLDEAYVNDYDLTANSSLSTAVSGVNVAIVAPATQPVSEAEGLTTQEKLVVLKELDDAGWTLLWKAVAKELKSFKTNRVLKPVSRREFDAAPKEPGVIPIPMRFVFEWRLIDGAKDIKARLVAQGTEAKDKRVGVPTSVALPPTRVLRMLLAYHVQRDDWNPETSLMQADLKTAFLQAPHRFSSLWVRCPKVLSTSTDPEVQALVGELFGKDGIAKVEKSLYGTRDASVNLDLHVREKMLESGYVECPACPNLYGRFAPPGVPYAEYKSWTPESPEWVAWEEQGSPLVLDSDAFTYVDDLIAGSGNTPALTALEDFSKASGLVYKDGVKPPTRYTGLSVTLRPEGIYLDQHAMANSLLPDELIGPDSIEEPPLLEDEEQEEFLARVAQAKPEDYLGPVEHTQYRSVLGATAYLFHTHIQILFLISFMGRFAANPTRMAFEVLKCVARFARSHCCWGIALTKPDDAPHNIRDIFRAHSEIPRCPSGGDMRGAPAHEYGHPSICRKWHLDLVTDATANDAPNQAGYIIFLNYAPVAFRSFMQRRVLLSSATSEGYGMYQGLDTLACLRYVLTFLTNEPEEVSCAAHTDAKDVCHVALSTTSQSIEEGRRALDTIMRAKLSGLLPHRHASPLPPEAPHVLLKDPDDPHQPLDVYEPLVWCPGDETHAPHLGYFFSKRFFTDVRARNREVAKADRLNKVLSGIIGQDKISLYYIPTKFNVADQLTKATDLRLIRRATMCRVPRFEETSKDDSAPT